MSFILLGILNSQAAGAPGGAGDYQLLETTVLGSDTASVTFSSLNSTYGSDYKHLQIRFTGRTDTSGANTIRMRFNSDSTSSYARHFLLGNGSTVSSPSATSQTEMSAGSIPDSADDAGNFGGSVVDILDPFSTSKNTTIRALYGHTGGGNNIHLTSGLYFKTDAITSFELFESGGNNFVTGSRFSLYGLKETV